MLNKVHVRCIVLIFSFVFLAVLIMKTNMQNRNSECTCILIGFVHAMTNSMYAGTVPLGSVDRESNNHPLIHSPCTGKIWEIYPPHLFFFHNGGN